jgi:molybdopterin/thiamine biosynthesis adenylyltransferase
MLKQVVQKKGLVLVDKRYHRQELFQQIGVNGQKQLADSHVLIVGVGALGSSSSEMLARAGVGKLTIADRDYVELTNLQRQHLFTERDVEEKIPKAIAAKNRLVEINSTIDIDAIIADIGADELEELIQQVDLVIDATDNFDTRLVINDLAIKYAVPWIYGGCVSSYGITFTVIPNKTPCLQCLLEHIPNDGETCDTVGILSPAVQMVVAHQVSEALKILTGNEEALSKQLIAFDVWKNQTMSIRVDQLKKVDCVTCAKKQYPYLTYEAKLKTTVLCGRNTVQIRTGNRSTPNFEEIATRLKKTLAHNVSNNNFLLSFEIDSYRIVVFKDGRTFIHGTNNITEAKKLYYGYVSV